MWGWEWYPLAIQLWIWGSTLSAAAGLGVLLWLLWGRPLRDAREQIETTEGYRAMALMDGKRRIDTVVEVAEREILDQVVLDQRRRLNRFGNLQEVEWSDGSR